MSKAKTAKDVFDPEKIELLALVKELDEIVSWVGTPQGFTYDEFYPPALRERVEKVLA